MEAFINFLALIGVALVPVGILLAIRQFGEKRNLDERYAANPPESLTTTGRVQRCGGGGVWFHDIVQT